jgi:hypothetical protein
MEPWNSLPCSQQLVARYCMKQLSPVHILTYYFGEFHINIVLPFMSRSQKRSIPFNLCCWNLVCIYNLLHACYMFSPSLYYHIDESKYVSLFSIIEEYWDIFYNYRSLRIYLRLTEVTDDAGPREESWNSVVNCKANILKLELQFLCHN